MKKDNKMTYVSVLCGVDYKLTKGGFEILKFKKLEQPIERGILEPMIYEGKVKTPDLGEIEILWDKFGRCSNFDRFDCFVDTNANVW